MGEQRFSELNRERNPAYRKDERNEDFLSDFNAYLFEKEKEEYAEHSIDHPFIFVIGAPRSGTTLLTQTIAHSLDVGYIDNLAARFFKAPLHGMRFSRAVFGKERRTDHGSDHAATRELSDIHEFGYFWRELLQKKSFEDISYAKEREERIDWAWVRKVLGSMQKEAGRPMVFKNLLGSYHMPRFERELGNVLFVHIVRDEMDAALSILDARKKYDRDPKTWWSYQPIEYEALKDRDPYEQIAGQVHCLKRFFRKEMEELSEGKHIEVHYQELCEDPAGVLAQLSDRCKAMIGEEPGYYQGAPSGFEFRHREARDEDRVRFEEAFRKVRQEFPL